MMLALVGMLVLAVGMYTTYSISRAVFEKIQLQNAADATAYSMATLEARSFNFIALVNRAQIANYVQMMEAQSLLSNLTFIEGITGYFAHILQASGKAMSEPTLIEKGKNIEDNLYKNAKKAVDALEEWAPRYIELQTTKNHALFALSAALVLATSLQVAEGAPGIIAANDPDADTSRLSRLLFAFNAVSYASAFDPATFGFGDENDQLRARRIMTELVNASRSSGLSADPKFIISRMPYDALLQAVTPLVDVLKDKGGILAKVREKVEGVIAKDFTGTTKMLSDASKLTDLASETDKAEVDASYLNRGGALVAKDFSKTLSSLFNDPSGDASWNDQFASVISTAEGGRHCRFDAPSEATFGEVWSTDWLPKMDCHDGHRWQNLLGMKGGITPFISFAPKLSGLASERTSFNQPDVWVLLHKPPSAMTARKKSEDPHFVISQGGGSASFDSRIGEDGLVSAEGMHALARAQVYYHRPGAWQEMPNFFNPFWNARLAPKNAVVNRLFAEVGVPSLWAQLVTDNVWMY
jgi:hypothetical protein